MGPLRGVGLGRKRSLDAAGAPEMKTSTLLLFLLAGVQDKNFYLLSAFEDIPEVRQSLNSDPALKKLSESKRESLSKATQSCKLELDCYAAALKWTEPDTTTAAERLRDLYRKNDSVKRLVDGKLRKSGMFQRYRDKTGDELLSQAWLDAVRGIDNIIDVYGTGRPPRYPQIDSVT